MAAVVRRARQPPAEYLQLAERREAHWLSGNGRTCVRLISVRRLGFSSPPVHIHDSQTHFKELLCDQLKNATGSPPVLPVLSADRMKGHIA